MKVLLIEDNRAIAKNIKNYLTLDNWVVEVVFDGMVWLQKIRDNRYDIVILDYMLPGMDGVSIISEVRKNSSVPIIMITALDDRNHILVGLESGTDDYLIKPFDLKELEIRMSNILKRTLPVSLEVYSFEDIIFDATHRTVTKNHIPIHLYLKEYMIVEYLLQHIGKPVPRSEIIEYIWWGEHLFEKDNLDVYISGIRKKLTPWFIQTIKGYGYMISPSV